MRVSYTKAELGMIVLLSALASSDILIWTMYRHWVALWLGCAAAIMCAIFVADGRRAS